MLHDVNLDDDCVYVSRRDVMIVCVSRRDYVMIVCMYLVEINVCESSRDSIQNHHQRPID